MTAVTCPTVRTHPGIVAHAAATTATLMPGRFRLGVGSGEALNEHIFGARWPQADVRLEMLEEAVEVIRLWQGGAQSHHGRHYTLESRAPVLAARRAAADPRLGLRAEGDRARRPDRRRLRHRRPRRGRRRSYREHGGRGPITGGLKVCWGPDREECVRTAHRLWPNEALTGELAQILPSPHHFEQATELVTEQHIADALPCGPDPRSMSRRSRRTSMPASTRSTSGRSAPATTASSTSTHARSCRTSRARPCDSCNRHLRRRRAGGARGVPRSRRSRLRAVGAARTPRRARHRRRGGPARRLRAAPGRRRVASGTRRVARGAVADESAWRPDLPDAPHRSRAHGTEKPTIVMQRGWFESMSVNSIVPDPG